MNNFFSPIFGNKYIRPYYPIPRHLQNNYSNYNSNFQNLNKTFEKQNTINFETDHTSNSKKIKEPYCEKPIFEILGIQLYTDDLLILSLILFLYKEHINDMLLFIALISLLF